MAPASSSFVAAPDRKSGCKVQQHPWDHGDGFTHTWAPPVRQPHASMPATHLPRVGTLHSLHMCFYPPKKHRAGGGPRSSGRRADPAPASAPSRGLRVLTVPAPQESQRSFRFFITCTCTALIFLQGYGGVYFFFPNGSWYLRQGMCVFPAYSAFQTGKCPLLQPEALGFTPHSCRNGTPSSGGVSPGGPRSPHRPGEGGAGCGRALIPLRPTAGPGGGNPPSSSAGKASLTRANENNQK